MIDRARPPEAKDVDPSPAAVPDYEVRVTRLSVVPPKEPLFSERCTHVTIMDEAAGEYLEVEQQSGHVETKLQTIQVTPAEWPALKEAVETLLRDIHEHERE